MRMLLLAAVAGLTALTNVTADAADMRTPVYKAPPAALVSYNWSGCYVGAGGGYGVSNEETALVTVRALPGIPLGTRFVDGITQGGRGWFGTAQVGCDIQFGGNWLIGAFADGSWGSITGRHTGGDVNIGLQQGEEKLSREWAVGGRVGWIVTPQFLTFFSAGYTQASFSEVNYVGALFPTFGNATGLQLPARTHRGWFIGGGTEYAISFMPGLFWKNEYRFGQYDAQTNTVFCTNATQCGVVGATAFAEQNHPYVQTIRTELVWRFNFGGR